MIYYIGIKNEIKSKRIGHKTYIVYGEEIKRVANNYKEVDSIIHSYAIHSAETRRKVKITIVLEPTNKIEESK